MSENEHDSDPSVVPPAPEHEPTPDPAPEPESPPEPEPTPEPEPVAPPEPEPTPEPEPPAPAPVTPHAPAPAATPEPEPAPEPAPAPEPTSEPFAPPADVAEQQPPSAAKADIANRAVALVIDGLCAFVVGFIPGIGGLLGAAYMLLRDGLELDFMNHRSIGKTCMKLHIQTVDGSPIDVGTSLRRNWMFALGPLAQTALFIPILGWFILLPLFTIGAILLAIVEIVLVLTDAEGRRIGDKIAGTVVRAD